MPQGGRNRDSARPEKGLPPAPLVAVIERYMRRELIGRSEAALRLDVGHKTLQEWGVGSFATSHPYEWQPGRQQREFVYWVVADVVLTRLGLNWFDVYNDETCDERTERRAAAMLGGEAVAV